MEPVSPIGVAQVGLSPPATPSAPSVPAPGVAAVPVAGASGLPAAAPVAAPVVTPAVESPEIVAIRAETARLNAEIARLQPWAQRGYQTSLAQPAVPAIPMTPAAPKTNVLGVPDLDPGVQAYLTTDAGGNVVATADAPPGVMAQYNAHQRALGVALKRLATNPEEALAGVIAKAKDEWLKEAKTELTSEQQKAQNAQTADRIVQANSEWLFEKDAAGNRVVVTDPLTGQSQYKRTEGGEWWATSANRLMQAGISDPVLIDRYARADAFFQAWQKSQAAAPAPTAPVAPDPALRLQQPDLRQAFLNRIPGAAPGSVAPPGSSAVPQGQKLTLRDAMLQGLTVAGYSPGSKLPMGIPQAA